MSLSNEEHAWLRSIENKIDGIQKDVAHIVAYGCSQAPRHDDHEGRIRKVEGTLAEGRGAFKMAHVLSAAIGGALTFFAGRIWK